MKALAGWILCVLLGATLQAQIVDGVYVITDIEGRPSIESQAGRSYHIGGLLDVSDAEIVLGSNNNTNDVFYLRLKFPYSYRAQFDRNRYVLAVDGVAYYFSGRSSSVDSHADISTTILGVEAKDKVANFFDCPVTYKRHPGHQFLVDFESDQKVYTSGEGITVTLKLTNVGKHPIAFMKGGRNRAARNTQFIFSGFHGFDEPLIDVGTNSNMGGLAFPVILLPGEVFEDEVNLSKWFEITKAGYYSIHASYFLQFVEPKPRSAEYIWQDYVSGDFMFSVEE